jgi:hypothetical protein
MGKGYPGRRQKRIKTVAGAPKKNVKILAIDQP